MEYLQGYNTWPDDPTQEQREKLKRKAIHGHENLRAPNILVKDDDLKLVDFDWAGKENEVRYHCTFNEDIKWHEDAKLGSLITKEDDDEYMFNELTGESDSLVQNFCNPHVAY